MKKVDTTSSLTDIGPGCKYGDAKYWDKRYENDDNVIFDWLSAWKDIKEIIEKNVVEGLYQGDVCVSDEEALKIK